MNQFVVSARKYRPSTFDTVVGQSHITNTLKNAIKNNHLAQAFLFCGPRGVGKTTCARILAKTINCENISSNVEACDKCESCISFNNNQSLNIYELDAASNNTVEDIRSLVDQVRYAPQHGKYKIYIIDEVHMLSNSAFNAFLKTLEEPPSYAIFILATTEKHKIIPTILSRCQIFDFNRIKVDDIASHLAKVATGEEVIADADALHIIAQKADGALRDALSMFDQIVSFAGSNVTYKDVISNLNVLDYDYYFKITDDIYKGDYKQLLLTFDELLREGFDAHNFINGLSEHYRNLMVSKDAVTLELLEVTPTVRDRYKKQAHELDGEYLLALVEVCNRCDVEYKSARNQRLHVELALLKMSRVKKKSEFELDFPFATAENLEDILALNAITTSAKEPNQPSEKALKTIVDSSASIDKIAVAEKVEPIAKASNPTSTIRLTPSLAALGKKLKPVEEKTETELLPVEVKNKNGFVLADLFKAIEIFAQQVSLAGKRNLAYTLSSHKPQINDNYQILFVIDSNTQEQEILSVKLELVTHLRTTLKNDLIHIATKLNVMEAENSAYTPLEKFKKMAEKNPALNDLKTALDLDFGY